MKQEWISFAETTKQWTTSHQQLMHYCNIQSEQLIKLVCGQAANVHSKEGPNQSPGD